MRIRVLIDKERCKGCALCVSVCPREILRMTKELNSRGDHYPETNEQAECSGCLQCAHICPDAAIEIEQESD